MIVISKALIRMLTEVSNTTETEEVNKALETIYALIQPEFLKIETQINDLFFQQQLTDWKGLPKETKQMLLGDVQKQVIDSLIVHLIAIVTMVHSEHRDKTTH